MMKNQQSEEIFVSTNGFDGPVKSRRCTDILFLILFLICFLCMNLIGLAATGVIPSQHIPAGNPNRLIRGMDYMGNICGVDNVVKDFKALWKPNFLGITPDSQGTFVPMDLGICISSCPQYGDSELDPYGNYGSWVAPVSTSYVLGYCIPLDTTRLEQFAVDMFGDFIVAAKIISTLGFVVAVASSILFLVTIRIPMVLRSVVWSCITIIFCILAGGGYAMWERVKAEEKMTGPSAPGAQQIMMEKALGAILAIAAVLWLSLICAMRVHIALAISIVRESVKALLAMPLLMFFPLIQAMLFGAATVLWVIYSIYLVSSGEVVTVKDSITGIPYATVQYDTQARQAILFLLFCWLWVIGMIEALGHLISSHAVLVWYFAVNRRDISTCCQVFSSAGVILRFHSGTAAFGSFLIAIIQTIRAVLEYIKVKLQLRQGSCLVKLVICCLSCCLYCFEKCLKYLTLQAYVQCALFGTPFCASAYRSFGLILRNLGRLSAVTIVGDFVVLVGKLSISLCSAGFAYLCMERYLSDQLNGFVIPTIFVGYLAYRVASLFLGVVTATSNTILQGFIIEEEMNLRRDGGSRGSDPDMLALKDCVSELKRAANNGEEDEIDIEEAQTNAIITSDFGDNFDGGIELANAPPLQSPNSTSSTPGPGQGPSSVVLSSSVRRGSFQKRAAFVPRSANLFDDSVVSNSSVPSAANPPPGSQSGSSLPPPPPLPPKPGHQSRLASQVGGSGNTGRASRRFGGDASDWSSV